MRLNRRWIAAGNGIRIGRPIQDGRSARLREARVPRMIDTGIGAGLQVRQRRRGRLL